MLVWYYDVKIKSVASLVSGFWVFELKSGIGFRLKQIAAY